MLFSLTTYSQLVSTNSALATAISNATAGTTIILANGTWTNVQININKTGTQANPITIKAQTAGSVFFEGNSYVKMGGSYIFFEGVIFRNPSGISPSTPVIEFKSSSDCSNCKLTNVKIDAYNATGQETTVFKWVLLRGQYNEISYCSFLGKYGIGSIINDNRENSNPNYHKIHHNYFAGRTPVGQVNDLNDQDAIRIGNSSTSLSDSFSEVYDNYFDNFSGEVEVISNKSCKNKYYNNTFRDYQGALTLRHGNDCEVYNNFFIANNKLFSGGIRVMGENHKIYNNYIEGVNSKKVDNSTSSATGGINVSNGRVNTALNGYYQVKNVTITNNTFVNCDYGLRIGTSVASDLTLAPENLIVANNVLSNVTTKAIQVSTTPIGTSLFQGNIRQGGSWDITTGTNGNAVVSSGLLASTKTDFYRLITGSAAIDAGLGSYSFLTFDITGGNRTASFDVGAEEFNSGGTRVPYTASDVGVKVGFGANGNLSVTKNQIAAQNLMIYPVPLQGEYLNVHFKGESIGKVQIVDLQGKILMEAIIDTAEGQLEISKLPPGIYALRAQGVSELLVK
ncbi:lyase [Flavobacterium sp. UMI-01]|nr:alginate lyase [Flavobacterium sp. UMI-01]GIZ07802.1 lyase [Flavobacterium sp. UMI-01]